MAPDDTAAATAIKPGDRGLEARLERAIEGDVLFDRFSRGRYSTDASIYQIEPLGVVQPKRAEDIEATMAIAREHGVPVLPRGGGTSQCGQTVGRALVVDCSRYLRSLVSLDVEGRSCVVEPGITRKELNEHLRDQGLFFPLDPGADASLGGMAATRCSGTNAVRYGTMKDNVLALKVVLANGEVMTTARRAKKSSAGYDLTRLIVGSEGTLGVITELTLKLTGIPEAISAGVCPFPSVEAACNAAIATIQSGIPVARIELLDEFPLRPGRGAVGRRARRDDRRVNLLRVRILDDRRFGPLPRFGRLLRIGPLGDRVEVGGRVARRLGQRAEQDDQRHHRNRRHQPDDPR